MFQESRTRELFLATAMTVLAPATGLALDLSGSLGEGGHSHYVAPTSNPILNETPYITTEIRPMWMHQEVPSSFLKVGPGGGADIDVIAAQIRVAITDRLGFIATKDGWADIDFDDETVLQDESGFANLAFGLKYALISDPETNTLLTGGIRYEAPSGDLSSGGVSMQGGGDGLIDLFVTGARTFGAFGLQASLGSQIAIDGSHDTSFLHYSVHGDYEVAECFYPLLEMNGYSPIDDGGRLPGAVTNANGMDLVNLGAKSPDTIVTIAPGFRFRLHKNVDFGAAFEVPMTDAEDLMDWRITTDFLIHL